jgi:hypothetical protein
LEILEVYGSVVDHLEVGHDVYFALKANQDLAVVFQVLEKGIWGKWYGIRFLFVLSLFFEGLLLTESFPPVKSLLVDRLLFLL